MHRRRILWLFSIGIFIAIILVLVPVPSAGAPYLGEPALPAAARAQILAATLQIELHSTKGESLAGSGRGDLLGYTGTGLEIRAAGHLERGLGTLIGGSRGVYLLTHDHWSLLEGDLGRARFYDAYGTPLLEMGGEQFRSLIRARKEGSLLLDAPYELTVIVPPDNLDDPGELELRARTAIPPASVADVPVGEQVWVVHHTVRSSHELRIDPAMVEAKETLYGVPVYTIRNAKDRLVVNGDSGGGVFLNGVLIGNLYGTRMATDWPAWETQDLGFTRQLTEISYAARLPVTIP